MNDEFKFDAPDGDIILRALGPPSRDFRVHKLVLSLASSVFKDMFSLPQLRPAAFEVVGDADVEVVDVADPPHALSLVLRFIYPFPPPNIDNLDILIESLIIADKYDIEGARARLRVRLTKFANEDPLRVYAIASRFGLNKEADAVSSLTTATYLPALTKLPDDFKYVPATAYHKLIMVHMKHRESIEDAANAVPFVPVCYACGLLKEATEPKMRTMLVRIICKNQPVTVDLCLKKLGASCTGSCMTRFVGEVVGKLGKTSAIQS
jgi:hypothetical protein